MCIRDRLLRKLQAWELIFTVFLEHHNPVQACTGKLCRRKEDAVSIACSGDIAVQQLGAAIAEIECHAHLCFAQKRGLSVLVMFCFVPHR